MANVIVSPHYDDEFIGCYSQIISGKIDKVIVVTDGGKQFAYIDMEPDEYKNARKLETKKFCLDNNIKDSNIVYLNFPDGGLSNTDKLSIYLKLKKNINKSDTLFIPDMWGSHLDHFITAGLCMFMPSKHKIMYSITRRLPTPYNKRIIKIDSDKKWSDFKKYYPTQFKRLKLSNFPFRDREEYLELS